MLEARVGSDLNKAPWLRADHGAFGLEWRKAEGRLRVSFRESLRSSGAAIGQFLDILPIRFSTSAFPSRISKAAGLLPANVGCQTDGAFFWSALPVW